MSELVNLRTVLYAQVLPALQACRERALADAEVQSLATTWLEQTSMLSPEYSPRNLGLTRAKAQRCRSAEVQLALEHAVKALLEAIEKDGE